MALSIERIEERLAAVRLSASGASIKAGLGKDYIRNIKRGSSVYGRNDTLMKLAATLECSVAYLLLEEDEPGEPPLLVNDHKIPASSLPIRYEVGAGYWVEQEDRQAYLGTEIVGQSSRFAEFDQWLERVIGDSVDKEFKPGELVHVVDAIQLGYAPRDGDFVVVVSRERGGHKVERSVKQVVIKRDGVQLWPRSTNPRWQSPLDLSKGGQSPDTLEVEIVGLVIGSYLSRA